MSQAQQLIRRPVRAAVPSKRYWVLAEREPGNLEVLTTELTDGRRVMPVFSFEEEAAFYLRFSARGGCRVRQTGAGELVSLLYGPHREVELVALDPVSDAEADVVDALVSMERRRFVDVLLRKQVFAELL